ncbi:hypothetical protein LXL04_007601 [Taraxacum kok-saghyz]
MDKENDHKKNIIKNRDKTPQRTIIKFENGGKNLNRYKSHLQIVIYTKSLLNCVLKHFKYMLEKLKNRDVNKLNRWSKSLEQGMTRAEFKLQEIGVKPGDNLQMEQLGHREVEYVKPLRIAKKREYPPSPFFFGVDYD